MLKLGRSENSPLLIAPKWPRNFVYVSDAAYQALLSAQHKLAEHQIQLVLKRGFEPGGIAMQKFRTVLRRTGAHLFCFLYPSRRNETAGIFSANGHDKDGNSVDIAIITANSRLKILPYGVFTSAIAVRKNIETHHWILDLVWSHLRQAGFAIHSNRTEALQIHCDYNPQNTVIPAKAGIQ